MIGVGTQKPVRRSDSGFWIDVGALWLACRPVIVWRMSRIGMAETSISQSVSQSAYVSACSDQSIRHASAKPMTAVATHATGQRRTCASHDRFDRLSAPPRKDRSQIGERMVSTWSAASTSSSEPPHLARRGAVPSFAQSLGTLISCPSSGLLPRASDVTEMTSTIRLQCGGGRPLSGRGSIWAFAWFQGRFKPAGGCAVGPSSIDPHVDRGSTRSKPTLA